MFTHLLVPLDGSDLAELALPVALEIASRFESKVTLLRVIHPQHIIGSGHDFAGLYFSLREDMHREAAAYMAAKEDTLQAEGHHVHSRIVDGESVAAAILDTTEKLEVDAIVMSTHGRGGVKRWVFGSVADKILQQAHIPVLLIRSQPPEALPSTPPPLSEHLEAMRPHEELEELLDLPRKDR